MVAYSYKFKTALNRVAISEGGNDDDPNDEGGRTGQGITQSEYNRWLTSKGKKPADVWNMPEEHRLAIYSENYWQPMRCEEMPLPVAYMTFDSAVLHGVNFTKKAIQEAIGVRADGIIGPVTLAAAKAQDALVVLGRLRKLRWARMQSRPSFPSFKRGWKKRLDDVDANVKKMVGVNGG